MKRLVAALVCLSLAVPASVAAQGNDDDRTPLNSRIKRSRQFPTDLPPRHFDVAKTSAVNRARSKVMLNQFSACIYKRSKEGSVALLNKTDAGFMSFEQIKLENDRAARVYGFNDCLSQVANANNSGVLLHWTAPALRQWLIQEAYFDRYREGPSWVKPGNVIAERSYVLTPVHPGIRAAMDLADCIVASDPNNADFFFRTSGGSPEENEVLKAISPVIGACLPQGQRIQLQPVQLRQWIGEALWFASNNNAPAVAGAATSKVAQ